jgi:hypothetical protein
MPLGLNYRYSSSGAACALARHHAAGVTRSDHTGFQSQAVWERLARSVHSGLVLSKVLRCRQAMDYLTPTGEQAEPSFRALDRALDAYTEESMSTCHLGEVKAGCNAVALLLGAL